MNVTSHGMYRRSFLALSGAFLGSGCSPFSRPHLPHDLTIDSYTRDKIHTLTSLHSEMCGEAARLSFISEALLRTSYLANHLIGSAISPEKLVVDLRSVDCLSFLEYVIALTHSRSLDSFLQALVQTRYSNNIISFPTRRHFFSDWSCASPLLARDVTQSLSSDVVSVTKKLNQKADGSLYLPGIPVKERRISYLPSSALPKALPLLKTGDLIGIYSGLPGLDVSHTGFAIWRSGQLFFRNASSLKRNRYVVDTPLNDYMHGRIGLVVLRPLERACLS
ncbi:MULTISPECIES: N-acetylmuramoyl-L-alanine amidase-like domain-containing protein [unclassified Saccharibacter]|uniref:N-acetylmuramoyl-L-alanine amidase-like domain-containing protein n=1 Tax=unclassified Saccharibacter TaxID=2648722 RepID=UPI0013224E9C|nr:MULTISPECIES: N-acetylmuramoyl-L-alanine amidase-like domain-containing protein [unclassified Saccharibacter]MXV36711.1 DUF1460 domain-containing protein [Saccharibacter sp. EH611]MXV58729.1 DUF1460 domain-containing protein [Saccharibacter sp. EH70]MXV65659.1 DUF1460 domain-containing protein [Saccharibacter sp. EH60]